MSGDSSTRCATVELREEVAGVSLNFGDVEAFAKAG